MPERRTIEKARPGRYIDRTAGLEACRVTTQARGVDVVIWEVRRYRTGTAVHRPQGA